MTMMANGQHLELGVGKHTKLQTPGKPNLNLELFGFVYWYANVVTNTDERLRQPCSSYGMSASQDVVYKHTKRRHTLHRACY
jgi:hypothetical protein